MRNAVLLAALLVAAIKIHCGAQEAKMCEARAGLSIHMTLQHIAEASLRPPPHTGNALGGRTCGKRTDASAHMQSRLGKWLARMR